MPKEVLQDDTISFTGVKNFVKATLRSSFGLATFLQLAFIRRKWSILLGLVLGLALGYAYYLSKPTYYRVSMVVQFNELTKKTYAEMIDQLNLLVSRGTKNKALGEELGIPQSTASEIIAMRSMNMNGDLLSADTSTRVYQTFKVLVDVSDIKELGSIQASLLNYFNNSPYLKRKREEQIKLYTNRIKFIDLELEKLDSLKTEYNRFLATSKISATFYNNAFDPADIYDQSTQLANQRDNLMRWLTIDQDAVSIVDGFKPVQSPKSISLLIAMLFFGIVGAFVAYLLSFARELKRAVS
jgi:hypothetical protein